MNKGWTPERRNRQAELIRDWRPWEKCTGPKTPEGKRASARRGYRGAVSEQLRVLNRILKEQQQLLIIEK